MLGVDGWIAELGHDDTLLILLLMCGLGAGEGCWAGLRGHAALQLEQTYFLLEYLNTRMLGGPVDNAFMFIIFNTIPHSLLHISRRRTLSLCSLHPLCCCGMLCVGAQMSTLLITPGVRTAGHYASKYYEQSS